MRDSSGLAAITQIVWRMMQLYGMDPAERFRASGIDPAVLDEPRARIPLANVDALVVDLAARIRQPGFALGAADVLHPSNLGVLGYAWLSSSSLRTGLQRLVRYWRILAQKSSPALIDEPAGLRFVFRSAQTDPALEAVFADFVLSVVIGLCRMNAGDRLRPVVVALKRTAPSDVTPYADFFDCPVGFGAAENSFVLTAFDADRPLETANRELAGTLDAILLEQLARLNKDDIATRVRAVLLAELSVGRPPESRVAKSLHMSRRTLQRKLAAVGVSYEHLVDETRRELALRYVEDRSKSITDITFTLGFSQQSAFTRAFRRWAGVTPSQYRTDLRRSPNPVEGRRPS